jgi:hypothetical protein
MARLCKTASADGRKAKVVWRKFLLGSASLMRTVYSTPLAAKLCVSNSTPLSGKASPLAHHPNKKGSLSTALLTQIWWSTG